METEVKLVKGSDKQIKGLKLEIIGVPMNDPTWNAGESHAASLSAQNQSPVSANYTAQLYLGTVAGVANAAIKGAVVSFTLGANGTGTVALGSLTAPTLYLEQYGQSVTYHTYVDINYAGALIATIQGTGADVVINTISAIKVTGITWA